MRRSHAETELLDAARAVAHNGVEDDGRLLRAVWAYQYDDEGEYVKLTVPAEVAEWLRDHIAEEQAPEAVYLHNKLVGILGPLYDVPDKMEDALTEIARLTPVTREVRMARAAINEIGDAWHETCFAVSEHARDDLPERLPADEWFWASGDRWVAVYSEFHDDWWEGADPADLAARPDPWRRPIDEVPESGTTVYRNWDGEIIEEWQG